MKTIIVILVMLAVALCGHAQEAADSLTRSLQEVVVTAHQPATRLEGSTLVSTIAGSNLAALGTALDVLAQLPMIKVEDDAVSVIGKNDVEIYIDGRPMRDGEELQQLRSSDLKKVELLMAPGAAYASTVGAVLKITTRRNFVKGLSVTDRLQLQRRRRWSVTDFLGASYRSEAWEFFVDGSVNRNNTVVKGITTNKLIYDGRETEVGSRQNNRYPTIAGTVKAGFNYGRGSESMGAYYRYNPEAGDFTNRGAEWYDSDEPLRRDIDRHVRSHSHLLSLYYENRFADRYLLHFDGDFRRSRADNRVATTYPMSSNEDVTSTDLRKSTLWAGKLTLAFPLWGGDMTVGLQDSYTCTSLDYQMLSEHAGQYIPSSLSKSRQISAAAFASWARNFGPLSLSVGARYEYVDYDFTVDGQRDEEVSRRDYLLTPDISLGYTFSEDAQISFSYKMATVKPPYSQLTGSLSYTGLHEIEGGNPALRDEKRHNLQLFGSWKGFMLQADYSRSLDTYAFVKQPYPASDLQLLMHPVNVDVSALSLYAVWSKSVGRWTPNITAGLYRQWLAIDKTRYDKPLLSYYFENAFSLPRGWTLTANVSGSSQGDMHTNRFGASWFTMDASIGKSFLDKSLQVKLSATDIFNTANNDWSMDTYGVCVDKRQTYDRRGIVLNLTYSFQPGKSRYKGRAASETELRRL